MGNNLFLCIYPIYRHFSSQTIQETKQESKDVELSTVQHVQLFNGQRIGHMIIKLAIDITRSRTMPRYGHVSRSGHLSNNLMNVNFNLDDTLPVPTQSPPHNPPSKD